MPSASETTPRSGKLATRVVIAAVFSAAVGGAISAVIAVVMVDRMVTRHDDQRLGGAAAMLAGELDEDRSEPDAEGDSATLADENDELEASGIQFALYQAGKLVAGESWVPLPAADSCDEIGRIRACGRSYHGAVIVAASPSDRAALGSIYVLSASGALLLGGLLGAAVSARSARWALAPLHELTAAIARLNPARPAAGAVGATSSCEEVRAIQQALAELLGRVEVLLGHAQRFAADAAHELRSPLAAIRAELELLLEAPEPDRAALARLRDRTLHLIGLVERLLILAAPPAQHQQRFEPVALSEVIAEVLAALPAAQRARVHARLDDEGLTRGEPLLLSSMVSNAIDNALKFSGGGDVSVALIDAAVSGEHAAPAAVRVEVRNPGSSLSAEQRARVFEPFYRAHPLAARGHGLGLPLIGHIAEVHGGRAEFEDCASGACLVLSLPAWNEASAAQPQGARSALS